MKFFRRFLEQRAGGRKQARKNSRTDASPSRVRVTGIVKLMRNTALFISFCYVIGFNALLTVGFGYFVYFSWEYVPEIVTGVSFEKTSERARGVTILLGFSILFLLLILVFMWLSRAAAQAVVP